MVTAPAKTGITAINKYAVINHDQTNKGIFIKEMPGALMFIIVTTTFIDPIMDEAPIMWTENIKKVTLGGAYVVDKGA
tara:strand:+ start:429 stop:662 length:234 start_codon:yes stop_codon:yes gene_type:complete